MKYNIINLILMQVGWFSCVIGGNLWAVPSLIIILILHFTFVCKNDWSEIKFILPATIIGFSVDSLLMYLGALKFNDQSHVIPIWLICLWGIFATSLNHCLNWTRKKPLIGAVAGFLLAPITYYSGTRFDSLMFADNIWFSWFSIGIAWGVMMPVFAVIANKLKNKKDQGGL